MHPILFRLGPWEARSYGVLLALSFLGGVLVARARAPAHGIDPKWILRLGVIALVATFVGARLVHVLVNPEEFREAPLRIINLWQDGKLRLDGLVMNGGLMASLAAFWGYLAWKKLPVLATLDVMAPCLGLGLFLTRIGCFLNGCCYGKPTALPWGVVYPAASPAGQYQRGAAAWAPPPLHPTQLYAALYGAAILAISIWAERRRPRPAGFTLALVLGLYGIARFVEETFRHYDSEIGVFAGLTHNQYLAILLVAGSIAGMVLIHRRPRPGQELQTSRQSSTSTQDVP